MRFLGALFALGGHAFYSVFVVAILFIWWDSRDLPGTDKVEDHQPDTLSRVYAADGAVQVEFVRERRLVTPYDEFPELLVQAFISAEDKNFFKHGGIDGVGLAKAMVDNVRRIFAGRSARGASTITQQVVKNFILSGEQTLTRKIKEALLAVRLERVLTKEKILERYLNEIFLGQNTHGVTAAAIRYFGKELKDLTAAEVAYLAALPKAPSTYHPVRRKKRATDRRDYVLREMFENGYLTKQQYDDAVATELKTLIGTDAASDSGGEFAPQLDYFSEQIRTYLIAKFDRELAEEGKALAAEGAADENESIGERTVYRGGLAVRSTMDPKLQAVVRRALQKRLWEYSRGRGYRGAFAKLDVQKAKLDPKEPKAWRKALKRVEAPRDAQPWRLAVVIGLEKSGARIVIEGEEGDATALLPLADAVDWAKPRLGADDDGNMELGPAPKTPGDLWAVGDVIYVTPAVASEEGAQPPGDWSLRQIPEVSGGVVAMDPHTGRVLAMQGGFSFQLVQYNWVTQAKRQPGSAIKPFVFAAALEEVDEFGKHVYFPNSIVVDRPVVITETDGRKWKPRNYNGRAAGPLPMRWGLEKSLNLMTVSLALDVKIERVAEYAERFGVYEKMRPLYSYALGAGETTLLKLTASYAMFANGGKKIEPTFIDRIQDRFGRTVFRHDRRSCTECASEQWSGGREPQIVEEGVQVMDPATAFQIVVMLEGVTTRGTAAKIGKALPFPVAGKTGTTNEARDALFVGFTPDLVVGCAIGFQDFQPLGKGGTGGAMCAPVFTEVMKGAAKIGGLGADGASFRAPKDIALVRINRKTGCVVAGSSRGPDFIWEAFRANEAPYAGSCPEGGLGGGGIRAPSADGSAPTGDGSSDGATAISDAVRDALGAPSQGGNVVRSSSGGSTTGGGAETPGDDGSAPRDITTTIDEGSGGLY